MSKQAPVYKAAGRTVFGCAEHGREVVVSWGAGYPMLDPPKCPSDGAVMGLAEGQPNPHDDSLLETAETDTEA